MENDPNRIPTYHYSAGWVLSWVGRPFMSQVSGRVFKSCLDNFSPSHKFIWLFYQNPNSSQIADTRKFFEYHFIHYPIIQLKSNFIKKKSTKMASKQFWIGTIATYSKYNQRHYNFFQFSWTSYLVIFKSCVPYG